MAAGFIGILRNKHSSGTVSLPTFCFSSSVSYFIIAAIFSNWQIFRVWKLPCSFLFKTFFQIMFQFLCADIPHCIQTVMISFLKYIFANSWIKNCAPNLLGLSVLHTVMQGKTEFVLISCGFKSLFYKVHATACCWFRKVLGFRRVFNFCMH